RRRASFRRSDRDHPPLDRRGRGVAGCGIRREAAGRGRSGCRAVDRGHSRRHAAGDAGCARRSLERRRRRRDRESTRSRRRDAALVARLLALGADVDAASPGGATALMWAVPDVAKMRLLLEAGADVDARSEEDRTAIVIASGIAGASPAVRLLLEYGADASASHGGVTPLREAARVDDPRLFAVVLKARGVSPA